MKKRKLILLNKADSWAAIPKQNKNDKSLFTIFWDNTTGFGGFHWLTLYNYHAKGSYNCILFDLEINTYNCVQSTLTLFILKNNYFF